MADRIDRDRAKDSSIKTDDLDLGSIDDISLDFPGDGDEGVEMGKGRKPTNPKKEFAIEFAKGLGGGVKSATVSELKKVLPEGAAIVNELGATFDDIKSLKDDLSRQLGPMTATIENATRKLLPKAEKYLPKKLYEKTKKKLDERAAMRQGYTSPSKEQIEQEQISAEIASLFSAQAETNMAELRERKTDELVNRAMGSVRHRQQIQQLTHLYDSVRATELFHRTQHMAYMKKSLELKYKHVFIARDTFNLLQQSMKTFEGYYKGILTNTALPDMVKTKIGDYHRKNRTEKYGNMMSEALSNIRGKIFDKIKGSVSNVMSQAGFMTDMLGMGADMADTMGGKGLVPNLLGKAAGFIGGSPIAKKMLGKLAPFTGALNTSLGGMKANAAVSMANLREKWQMSDNWFKNLAADFMPDTFSQSTVASNDLLSKGKEAATFDVVTRQSITEIIPGYLGKILHEVTKIQTGDANVEEQTYNVYERKFTDVSTLKADVYDRAFGEKETRQRMLNKTLAVMQAGVARNNPDKDAQKRYDALEKDVNRLFLNHAQYGIIFKPEELRNFVNAPDDQEPSTYIRKVCNGFEHNPKQVIEAICDAMYTTDGKIDNNVKNDIQLAITENYRKMDRYKSELPDVMETYGYRQFFSGKLSGQEEKKLRIAAEGKDTKAAEAAKRKLKENRGLITSMNGDNTMNFEEMVEARNTMDFDQVSADKEDWDRSRAYNRYRDFDRNIAKMKKSGGKAAEEYIKRTGTIVREEGPEYRDIFKVASDDLFSGRPEEKKGFTGDLSATLKNMGISTSFGGLKSAFRAAGDKTVEITKDVVDKLSPETKKQYDKAKAKIAELKKQLEGTETGKKVLDQLVKLESIYDEAAKQGDKAIQYLKDEGAFDDPTGFLKSIYGKSTTAVKGWTESLPSLSDTAGWSELLTAKKNDVAQFASTTAEAIKSSSTTKKALDIGSKLRSKATEIIGGLKDKAKEGLRDAGVEIPGAAPTGGGTVPPPPPITPVTDNVVEPEGVGSSVVVDRLDQLIGITSEWKKESTDNQGTIFDAITQIDEDLKKIPSFGGKGGADIGEALEALDPNYRRFKNRRRFLNKAANAVGAGIKGVGKMYTKVYGAALKGAGQAVKGLGYAAGNAIKSTYKAAAGIGKWLTTKEDYVDIYVKGKEGGMPIVSARKQKDPDEGIFYKSSGKRVLHSRDIDEPCVDKRGQLVITEEDLKAGLVMNNSTPIGKIGAGALAIAKGYFSVYGKALTAIGGVAKTVAKGLFGSGVERWQDVYRKDEVGKGPLLTARKQKEEGVYFFESGKKVEKTSDIHEPICDRDKKILISKEDIEHGLVNVDNKPLGSGGGGGIVGALARGVAAAMPGLGKFVGKAGSTLMDIYGKGYKGLMDVGFGALKGAGKFIGRALGLDMSGIGGAGDKETKDAIVGSHTMLKLIQADVALMAAQYKEEKNPLDKDGDGDIDGSYADQMQNKKDSGGTRVDAKDVHKDVNWLKEEKEEGGGGKSGKEDGGSIFDMLGKFLPKKWRAKLGAFKSAFGKKAMAFAKGAGSWMLKGGRALMTGAAGLFSKSLPFLAKAGGALKGAGGAALTGAKALGAKALPALGTAGKAALGAGKFLGGKAALLGAKALPMMGSAIGSAGSAIGGLASAAGPALMAAAPWLAGAAAVAGAGYLGYKALGIGGLIKGIKGNDNPLTEKEIEKGRTKLQRKIDKGMPGYDRILQEYEKAVSAQNWRRARELSGQEADGIIKSMWKESWIGKGISGIGNFFFGKKDEEMSKEEIEKTRAKFNSIIKKGGSAGKNAEKLLSKFEDYVSEQDWKNARKIAGAEKRGLFGKLFQDSKGNIKWGTVIGGLVGGIPGLVIGSLFNKADVNKPMTEEEVKKARERLQKLADGGNKAASKILDQFDEAVTEQNWKKARKLVGEEVQSNLTKLGGVVKTTAKWALRIGTLGLSTLFESDQDKPMSDDEIKKFTDKMNFLIEKHHDKLAKKKLEKFEEAIAAQKWDKARQIAKMPHKSLISKGIKNTVSFFFGDNDKEMTEQEMTKFRESMQRKIAMGSKTAQKKLDAFEDAVGAQRWNRARVIAGAPDDGVVQKGAKALGKAAANSFRFFFGGDGKPMSETEIEQARKEMGWAISEGKKGAQKRLDLFNDYVADEKWEKARKLAKMPYENAAKRVAKVISNALFGDDKEALTPEEIDKFQKECEQRVEDGDRKAQKVLDTFNSAVESENWKKARAISGMKSKGLFGEVSKGAKKVWDWFAGNSDYEDCQKIREELEEKAMDDETGLIQKGLEDFEKLVRRQKYNDAMTMAKDLLKMKPSELTKKYKLKSEAYEEILKQGQDLTTKIDKKIDAEKGWFSINRMRLKSLRKDLISDQESWSQDFFDDIRERLSSITGEDEFADIDKPDDGVVKRGEKLIKDITESQGRYSWLGSPIIRTQLANLKSEVQGDMTAWCDATIDAWKKRLKEIDKDYKDIDGEEAVKGTKVEEEVPVEETEEYKALAKKIKVLNQRQFEARFGAAQPLSEEEEKELAQAREDFQKLKDQGTVTKTKIVGGKAGKAASRSSDLEDYEQGVEPLPDEPEVKEGSPFKAEVKMGNETSKEKWEARQNSAAKPIKSGGVLNKIGSFFGFGNKEETPQPTGGDEVIRTEKNISIDESDPRVAQLRAAKDRAVEEKLQSLYAAKENALSRTQDPEKRKEIEANYEQRVKEIREKAEENYRNKVADLAFAREDAKAASQQKKSSFEEKFANGGFVNRFADGGFSKKNKFAAMMQHAQQRYDETRARFDAGLSNQPETPAESMVEPEGTSSPMAAVQAQTPAEETNPILRRIKELEDKEFEARFGGVGLTEEETAELNELRAKANGEEPSGGKALDKKPGFLSRLWGGIKKHVGGGLSAIGRSVKNGVKGNAGLIGAAALGPVGLAGYGMYKGGKAIGGLLKKGWNKLFGKKSEAPTATEETPMDPAEAKLHDLKVLATLKKKYYAGEELTEEEKAKLSDLGVDFLDDPDEWVQARQALAREHSRIKRGKFESKFARGGFMKFADGGFTRSEVEQYDKLVEDLEADKDLSPEDTYKATYYSDGTKEQPFEKPTEDDVAHVYGSSSKKDYLRLLNLARHAHKIGQWAVKHPEVYEEEEEHAGGVLNPLNWFAKGGFTNRFADGGFAKSNRDEVSKYEQLCEDLDNDKDLSEEDTYRALYYRYAAEGKPFKKPTEDDVIAVYGNADKKNFLKLLNLCRHAYGVGTWAMNNYDEAYGAKEEDEGFGLWDHIKGAGKGVAKLAASPVTGLYDAGKGVVTGDFDRSEYDAADETMTEKIVSAPGKAISNGLGWIGKGIGSLFASGGFTNRFAEGGFTREEVGQYDKLVEDLEADKDMSPEDSYRATYYNDGLNGKPFSKPSEDDAKEVYGSSSKKDYLRLLNLCRHAYKLGQWVSKHPEIYDEDEEHVGGVLNPMNWFASGGFATSETPAMDADGNPLVYGEAGTEAIMPIRSKPGNLLSRIGSKLGDILSGKPVGPMDDGASKASVHAGTDESEPMENMMANELAKTVRSRYRSGGFAKFAEGGFMDNLKKRATTLGMTALNAVLGPIADTVFAVAIVSIAPAAFVMLGPMALTLIELVATTEAAEAWEKGDYLKVAGFLLAGGIAPAAIVAFFGLLGVGGALMGATFMSTAVVGDAMGLLKGINKGLLPEACQEYVDKAIDSIGDVYSAVSGAALGTAATPLTATWNLGKAAVTGDFKRSEYVREGETALATALNAPHRAIDNAAGWAGKGIHAVGKGIGSLFGFGGSAEEPKQEGFSEESIRNMVAEKDAQTAGFATGGFVRDTSLVRRPTKTTSGAVDMVSQAGQNLVSGTMSTADRLVGALGDLKQSLTPKTPATNTSAATEDTAKKLAEMTEVNKQLLELLQAVISTNGIKVSGIDTLTEVCALSAQSGGGTPQPGPVQVIQQTEDSQTKGIDLRKKQM